MKIKEYVKYDGLGLAELVKKKEVNAKELKQAALEVLAVVNPKINVIATAIHQEIGNESNIPDGSFIGIPFILKDTPTMAAGVPANNGCKFIEGLTSDHDSELMIRFRKAGLIPIATSTVPELSSNATTESILYGVTRNPWNLDYSVGGSSGGSAAAVAAGVVPLAHGGDGGGSIRFPASCNGLIGLKPTRGRVPNGPDRGEAFSGLSAQFALTKTVRDTAALLDAIHGPDIGCYAYAEPPKDSYSNTMKTPPEKLRIAWTDRLLSNQSAADECIEVLHQTVKLCEELGYEVVQAMPEVDQEMFWLAMNRINSPYLAVSIDALSKQLNRIPSEENMEPASYASYISSKKMMATEFVQAINMQNTISRSVGRFFADYDILLTPTLGDKPAPIGKLYPMQVGAKLGDGEYMSRYMQFTPLFNMTGQPAISLPLGMSRDKLPIGMQFVGPFGDEETLLKLAYQIEIARPWKDRHAPLLDLLP